MNATDVRTAAVLIAIAAAWADRRQRDEHAARAVRLGYLAGQRHQGRTDSPGDAE